MLDVAAIAGTVEAVQKIDTVSSFIASLQERVDRIKPVVEHKTNEVWKQEEPMRSSFSRKELEIRRWHDVSRLSRSGRGNRGRP